MGTEVGGLDQHRWLVQGHEIRPSSSIPYFSQTLEFCISYISWFFLAHSFAQTYLFLWQVLQMALDIWKSGKSQGEEEWSRRTVLGLAPHISFPGSRQGRQDCVPRRACLNRRLDDFCYRYNIFSYLHNINHLSIYEDFNSSWRVQRWYILGFL